MSKKKELFYLILMTLLAVDVVVINIKYVHGKKIKDIFMNLDQASVIDRQREEKSFKEVINLYNECFLLILEISNCPSCISKAFNDIYDLKKHSKNVLVVVVYDWIDEWINWTKNYDNLLVFMMRKNVFYDSVKTSYLPIIIKIVKGKTISCKYIN